MCHLSTEFYENLFSSFCVILLTNKQTNVDETITSLAEVIIHSTEDHVRCFTSNLHRRSAVRGDLIIPSTRTVRDGPRRSAVAGPSPWNALPAAAMRNDELSIDSFRRQLKTELYIRACYSH